MLTNHLVVGGAEAHLVALATGLVRRGVAVAVAASPGPLVDQLPVEVRYRPIPLTDVRLSLPLAVARVAQFVAAFGPDVVVANSVATAWVARLAAPGRRVVQVAHGWRPDQLQRVAWASRVSDKIVAVSEAVAAPLRARGLEVRVVANGVDGDAFPRAAHDTTGPLTVVQVGRFVPAKAQEVVVRVAREVTADVRFVIIGYGPLEAELRRRIAAAGVDDRVSLRVGVDDVRAALASADLYLHTSRWEGLPLALLEAMAAGLPLVCTDAGGVGEVVRDNGVLCAVDDHLALARAIDTLAADPERRRAMGEASRRRVEADFSVQRMVEQLYAELG